MPSRPAMLDTITSKLKQAKVREIIKVKCCFKSCVKDADYQIMLRYNDGRTDIFGVCKADRLRVEELHPLAFDKTKEQKFFLY